jgi:hypothetical protein
MDRLFNSVLRLVVLGRDYHMQDRIQSALSTWRSKSGLRAGAQPKRSARLSSIPA